MRIRPAVALAVSAALALAAVAAANVALTQLSTDPFTNTTSQHKTEVEPDTYSIGSTIVAAMQVGRFFDGGSSGIGFATTANGGSSWTHGFLTGIAKIGSSPTGPYDRVSDPSVAFDAAHNVWLISSLPLTNTRNGGIKGAAVVVSRSTDGGSTWSGPVTVAKARGGSDLDKNWTACDNTPASSFYGNCYTQWDDFGHLNQVHVAFSSDGGLTWTEGALPHASVIGGQPLVQPNGHVVMPIDNGNETVLESFVSTDGGASWSGPFTIASVSNHGVAGGLRAGSLPSAEVDGAGKVYVAWSDCRFRMQCSSNDIVMSTSTDGMTWSSVTRVPIGTTLDGADHFIPGLAVDRATSGSSAHLGLTYYFYPSTSCSSSTCQLDVGFISSTDGGTSWSTATQLAGPMTLSWLPNTSQGRMVGDYISTSFAGGTAQGVFAVANAPTPGGSNCATATPNCDQAMYTPSSGLAAASSGRSSRSDRVVTTRSDHPAPTSPVTVR